MQLLKRRIFLGNAPHKPWWRFIGAIYRNGPDEFPARNMTSLSLRGLNMMTTSFLFTKSKVKIELQLELSGDTNHNRYPRAKIRIDSKPSSVSKLGNRENSGESWFIPFSFSVQFPHKLWVQCAWYPSLNVIWINSNGTGYYSRQIAKHNIIAVLKLLNRKIRSQFFFRIK